MCFSNGGGSCCWIILILILLFCCCGSGSWGGCGNCGCGNNCDNDCGC